MGGLIEVSSPNAEIMIIASGTAASQSREAIRVLEREGINVGLIKVKSVRPFPTREIITATEHAKLIVIPEFNAGGWLAREVKASLNNNDRVLAGPRVFGGMAMPSEVIVKEIKTAIIEKPIKYRIV
jgi:pyruvate ferredoxin oxidoreductase alpha subunit